MTSGPLSVLAVHPSVVLSKADRDRLRRVGIVVISADPSKVRAIEAISAPPLIPMDVLLRSALETLMKKRSYTDGQQLRSEFALSIVERILASDTAKGTATENPEPLSHSRGGT